MAALDTDAVALPLAARPAGVVHRSLRYRSTKLGVAMLAAVLLIAFAGPFLAPQSTTAPVGVPYAAPSADHLLGVDYLGRDAFSRFLSGGRSVVILAVAATLLGLLGGLALGLVAGYRNGWVDEVLMRLADIVMAFPSIILVLLLVAGGGSSLWLVVVAVAITHAPRIARVVRAATIEQTTRPYVEAAQLAGVPTRAVLVREILPNIWTPVLVDVGIRLTASIILIASVSFLGFGLQPPASDWGLMVNENKGALTLQPWLLVAPIAAISAFAISVNLIGDGIARASGRSLDRRQLVT